MELGGRGVGIVSLAGMLLFAGTWPAFPWPASFAVNAAVLITQRWLRWPPSGGPSR